ncbi:hypothetical protein B0A49_01819 [Cryomyces minteri]|uniref:Major facilitator superfamily (MFS) profile domain-containing protein n=1 Tax=Cryomyces minteri TaxID=331657 RepID=A0A4U0XRP7_9PEZI|nr:hypothetical protein B0A49_01819 [Cryomyces minteri]
MPGGVVLTGTTDTSRIEAPVTLKAYLMCAFAAFGGIFFGYDTGWMGGVLGMKYFIRQYTGLPYPDPNDALAVTNFHLTARDQSLTTSILSAGTFFGAIAAGAIADFIGRRATIIMGCVIFSIGCILETASTGLAVMVVGRLIAGLGVGFISAIIILYMSEIAPKKVRGALVAGYQFCITIGILLANCVVYATQNRDDTGSYRIPIAVQFLWALILGTGLFLLPESPRYYVKKGKLEAAAKSLASVRGQPIGSQYIQDELAEIIANHDYEIQVVGCVGYDCLHLHQHLLLCHHLGVIVGEVFPLTIRSRGVGLSTASNWFWNCIIGVITPYLVGTGKGQANLGAKIFFMWGALCCVSFSFAYFFVPETKGLSLEQVDKMLEESTPRTSSKWVPHSTFASEMGLTEKGLSIGHAEHVVIANEKSQV